MQALINYVEDKNKWNAIFGGTPLDVNSAEDRKKIADMIDGDLSPENLHCDGEASVTHVRKQHRMLTTAGKQLMAMDANVSIYELG